MWESFTAEHYCRTFTAEQLQQSRADDYSKTMETITAEPWEQSQQKHGNKYSRTVGEMQVKEIKVLAQFYGVVSVGRVCGYRCRVTPTRVRDRLRGGYRLHSGDPSHAD